jgi:hypothetical protein
MAAKPETAPAQATEDVFIKSLLEIILLYFKLRKIILEK